MCESDLTLDSVSQVSLALLFVLCLGNNRLESGKK